MEIDLTINPPPDLEIEIDISNPSVPRLPIYAALGVLEVWQFDGKNFKILGLLAGEYVPQGQSQSLPIVTVEVVRGLLNQAQEMGETSWAKVVRQWAKGQSDQTV
jgi:Uma2 family endonuclease